MCKLSCWCTTHGQASQAEHGAGITSIRPVHKAVPETCRVKTASALQFSPPIKVKGISTNRKAKCNIHLLVLREALEWGWQLETLDLRRMKEQPPLWPGSVVLQAEPGVAKGKEPVQDLHQVRPRLKLASKSCSSTKARSQALLLKVTQLLYKPLWGIYASRALEPRS